MSKIVQTLCPYCGVGCGLLATTDGKTVSKVRGDPAHPANKGRICLKGATAPLTINVPNRLAYPMIRQPDGRLHVVSSESAIHEAARRLDEIIQTDGPESIAFYLSGQMTTEAQYFFNKFGKGTLRTNHVDSNSRLCMSSAASAMTLSLGSDGPPTCYDDIELAQGFFFIGSNAAECHPVTFERVKKQIKKRGATCLVADPRKTLTSEAATLHLQLKPGTDLALLNGLLRILAERGCLDRKYIANHCEGFAELEAMVAEYPPDFVARTCGIRLADLYRAAEILAESDRLITFWTMGVNQTTQGTFTGNAIINMHLATGRIGRPGAGPFSLTGQPNAMGGRDVGYMSHMLPGQRQLANDEHRRWMETFWGKPAGTIKPHAGHHAVAMFDALESGGLSAIWIVASNPAASMPNLPKIRKALEKAKLVIVQDAYFPTETTQYAHIVLPSAVNFEQDGTFCNSERAVSLMRQVVPPPGQAKPDWQWGRDIAAAMGFTSGLSFANSGEIFDEFARSTAGRPNDQSSLTYETLSVRGTMQWPAPALGSSSRRRYTDGTFPTPTGKARFFARPHLAPEELPDREFPMLLTTGRVLSQWHTRTKTGQVPQLNKLSPGSFVSICPDDAESLGLRAGQHVSITSRRGRAVTFVKIDRALSPGTTFMPIHWNELWAPGASVNEATLEAIDPISKQPSLKYCVVKIAPLDVVQADAGSSAISDHRPSTPQKVSRGYLAR